MTMAWYGLSVLLIATLFASVNRTIIALVTEPLKQSLSISDTQIGVLNGVALTLVATIASYPMGWLADRTDRRILVAVCVLIWSAATAVCGLAQNFGQLFVCSIGIAVGEAVLGPITYSLIPDLFPRSKWIMANYVFYVAGVIGSAVGLSLSGGLIGLVETMSIALPAAFAQMETWRLSLFAVSLPGPLVAVLIMFLRVGKRIPPTPAEAASGLLGYMRRNKRSLAGVFLGFGFAAAASGTVGSWIAIALIRDFHESPASTGLRLGLATGIGSVVGVIVSALAVRYLRPRLGPVTPMRVAQIGVVGALCLTPFYLVSTTALHVYILTGLKGVAMTCALSLSPTLLQFIAPKHLRGRMVAVGGMAYLAFLSISPMVVGLVSDQLPAGPRALILAMILVGLPCYAAGAFFLGWGAKTLPQTLEHAAA